MAIYFNVDWVKITTTISLTLSRARQASQTASELASSIKC